MNKIELISEKQLGQLEDWFQKSDYHQLDQLTIEAYLDELEARVLLLNTAVKYGAHYKSELPWIKIMHNCIVLNEMQPSLTYQMKTSGVTALRNSELALLSEVSIRTNEKIGSFPHRTYANQTKREYLSSYHEEQTNALLHIDIANNTDKSILSQVAHLLSLMRKETGIQEPDESISYNPQIKTLKKFIDKKAIQYVDILLFCIFESPCGIHWHLTDEIYADLLFEGVVSADTFKKMRKNFYQKQLRNLDFTTELITNIRAEKDDLHLSINSI